MTLLINGGAFLYIPLLEFLTADVLIHEMTHADTTSGSIRTARIPHPFPYGLMRGWLCRTTTASRYSNENLAEAGTDNGQNILSLSEYGSGETFFSGSTEDRRADTTLRDMRYQNGWKRMDEAACFPY